MGEMYILDPFSAGDCVWISPEAQLPGFQCLESKISALKASILPTLIIVGLGEVLAVADNDVCHLLPFGPACTEHLASFLCCPFNEYAV